MILIKMYGGSVIFSLCWCEVYFRLVGMIGITILDRLIKINIIGITPRNPHMDTPGIVYFAPKNKLIRISHYNLLS